MATLKSLKLNRRGKTIRKAVERPLFYGVKMKLLLLRAIYFNHDVVTEGREIETSELHGRELINKGYAKQIIENALPESKPKKGKKEAAKEK